MEFSPAIHRRLNLAGALFGLALASVMLWTTQIAPILTLGSVPIDAASYGLNATSLGGIIALNLIGVTGSAYLVARLWERPWQALLCGGVATALVQVGTAYLITAASLENNEFAELILFRLPLGLLFGGLLWFVGGLIGSALERLALRGAARFFQQSGRAALGFALVLAAGAALGFLAGGNAERREQSIAAARAVNAALQEATGGPLAPEQIPPGFFASDPARAALATLRDQGGRPYRIVFIENDGREVVTVVRYEGGPAMRCVSTGAVISRCFRDNSPA